MRALGFAVLLGVAVLAGCGAPERLSTTPQPSAAVPVDVTEAKFDALDAAVNSHKGKVVLMDFWATWCPPCRKYFPDFVEAHKKHADKGLVCVSVSMDKVWERGGYSKTRVLEFLKLQGATFPNFVSTDRDDDRLTERFGLGRSIPYQALLNKEGKRVWRSTDWQERDITKAEYDAELDKLIQAELAK
ncbi:MAG: thioredoxin-like domain-containing protein [Gemmata sp.]